MGLFGKSDRQKLEEELEGLRVNIGTQSCFSGDVRNHAGIQDRARRIETAAIRLRQKGQGAEVDAVIDTLYEAKLPLSVLGGGPQAATALQHLENLEAGAETDLPPIKGSGTAAQEEEVRRAEISKLSEKRKEAYAYWKSVLDGLRSPKATA